MTLSALPATVPDLIRLVAVPVFAWAAIRDVRTRRVSSTLWIPLALLGAATLVWDGWVAWSAGEFAWGAFVLPAAVSLGLVVPIAYLFWWVGGFGGADAKALMVLALLFPTFPSYVVAGREFPVATTPVDAFSFTILTNAVLVGLLIPIGLTIRNAVAGRVAPVMVVGWPITWERAASTHGRLLQTPEGLSRGGLDLDALRMYLRWRGLTLADLRTDPDHYRNPATLPEEPNPPTDGRVGASDFAPDGGALVGDGEDSAERDHEREREDGFDDPWGAEAFLEDIEGTAYGTSPDALRDGLEVLVAEETVWISPGTPFLVPVFAGLLVALVYGDLLAGVFF